MTLIVAGAGSLSTSWLGALLGWQWGAIVAVCLGSLLLLLALLGTVGTRLLNRFSLLAFAALEGAVACGMLLSGVWCLALAGGSATISGLTWEAIKEEVGFIWSGREMAWCLGETLGFHVNKRQAICLPWVAVPDVAIVCAGRVCDGLYL